MHTRSTVITLAFLLGACAIDRAVQNATVERPLEVLPAGLDTAHVRSDIFATARARFGGAAVDEAVNGATYLLVKRFAGMAPPPPPGAPADWRPPTPTALLIRDRSGWRVATATGWRPANTEPAAEIDRVLADARFWNEPAYTEACPDFGSSNLVLKVPGRRETTRIAQCSSAAASLVDAALRA